MTSPLVHEKVWLDKNKFDDAERQYFEKLAKGSPNTPPKNSLAGEVAKARQHIKHSLECMDNVAALTGNANVDLVTRVEFLERDNAALHKKLDELLKAMGTQLDIKNQNVTTQNEEELAEQKKAAAVQAYNIKKASKPVLIAKSNIILDVKPWDDETNMKDLEAEVRKVTCDGLLWGASKLVPLAYGIHKLQISCVVEDEKVSIDWLQETLEAIEELVQSVDIAAFNKV